MLVLSRSTNTFRDDEFRSFSRYMRPGDCLVLNDTRVFPARLHGRRNVKDGALIEIFLTRPLDEKQTIWEALAKPGKRARKGDRIIFGEQLSAEILEEKSLGERIIRFTASEPVNRLLEQIGETPLPPYIRRAPSGRDRERYQTVFARQSGSAAAPTAGLHFTPGMLEDCAAAGAAIAHVTLHVGLGTFAPLRSNEVSEIELHKERFELPAEAAGTMRQAKRLVCVGTTSVRTVETALLRGGLNAMQGETNLFIYPGFEFKGTGAMLTNFHLPQSSLLMLVGAFAGRELTLAAYRHAVREKYRFFSYGDCMLIE